MVNVNKNIVPGKPAESSAKTEPQAPARRPRNQELNSSKKTVSVTHGETHATEQNPFKAKLNCSRKLNCSVTGNITSDVYDKLYTREDDPQKVADVLGCTVEDVKEIDSETEDLGYGKTVGYLLAKPEYEEELSQNGIEILSILEDGTVGMMVGRGFHTVETDLELVLDRIGENLDSACGENLDSSAEGTAEGEGDQSLNSSEGDGEGDEGFAEEPAGDADGGESVGEGADLADVKITTESGNEVSMQDIKIVQNPDTNELAIFIPEDEEETIPEGFTVIGMVIPDAVGSTPAIEGGDVCPECGQDPCVCEGEGGEDEGELDSSKKKNELNCSSSSGLLEVATEYYEYEHDALVDILQAVDDLGYGDSVYQQLIKNYGYEGTDAQQADEALIKMASEDADEHEFLVSLIQAIEDLGYGKQVYTEVLGIGGDIDSSLNCAVSEVTVPEQFARTKGRVFDLKNIVENELMDKGFQVNVRQVARPASTVLRFGFDGPDSEKSPEQIDAIIEGVVQSIVRNGWGPYGKREGDMEPTGLNSDLGGGDDRQDATSQVTVPKSFPDDKVHDLYRWVESELWNEGIDIDVYGVGRPSAGVISFEYEVVGKTPAEVDAIIEDRVQEFVQNGYEGLQYPEGDPRHGLNSEKHEKNLNCKVENARVEPTEQGTWVVKADTDRFGKDAILYEHYSEEGANKYLDRLKAGGDAVANGYDGHIDPKKVDLDSGDGTAEAKLDKASISKAMAKVLLEDKDTPLVYVKLKDGIQAYIQPAGYEDNQLVADGNFDDANIYVAMYDADYKPVMVNGKVDNKMKGSEIVDYIRRNLGM